MDETNNFPLTPSGPIPDEVLQNQEQAIAPPTVESMQEEEFVESFVDSQGIERNPSQPIVLLDKESRDAIDGFFVEHDRYADTIETTLDLATELRSYIQRPDKTGTYFGTLHSPEALARRVNAAKNATQSSLESIPSAESDKPVVSPLVEITDRIKASKTLLAEMPVISIQEGASIGDIKSYIERLNPDVKKVVDDIDLGGVKLRLSSSARNELIQQINYSVSRLRRETERVATDSGAVSTEIIQSVKSALVDALKDVEPTSPSEETADDHERRMRHGSEIDRGHTPVQNEEILGEFNDEISSILEVLRTMNSAEESALGALTSPDALEALDQLSEVDKQKLFTEITQKIGYVLKSDEVMLAHRDGIFDALNKGRNIDATIKYHVDVAMATVFKERALPMVYVSDVERTRTKELIDKYNVLIPNAISNPADYIDRKFRLDGLDIVAASQFVCHATSFTAEILASEKLRPKQAQLDNGVLHEQMRSASQTWTSDNPNSLTTHSSVPHFSEGFSPGYLMPREGGTKGIFLIPLADIVAVAPYDYQGRYLKILPSAPTSRYGQSTPPSQTNDTYRDDLVFYASPDYETSDDYEIPLDGSSVVIIQNEGQELQIPDLSSDHVRIVKNAAGQNYPVREVSQAIYDLSQSREVEPTTRVIIPLREGGIDFTPETPKYQGGSSRIRNGQIGRELTAPGDVKRIRIR
ncbi:MAG: hypothetical protein WCO19_05015 [Candidatus Saccharibacteria bacterium]